MQFKQTFLLALVLLAGIVYAANELVEEDVPFLYIGRRQVANGYGISDKEFINRVKNYIDVLVAGEEINESWRWENGHKLNLHDYILSRFIPAANKNDKIKFIYKKNDQGTRYKPSGNEFDWISIFMLVQVQHYDVSNASYYNYEFGVMLGFDIHLTFPDAPDVRTERWSY